MSVLPSVSSSPCQLFPVSARVLLLRPSGRSTAVVADIEISLALLSAKGVESGFGAEVGAMNNTLLSAIWG